MRENSRGVVATLTAFALLVIAPAAMACPVCFGADPGSPAAKALNAGIMVLLSVVGVVQMGFIALFWNWSRRSKEIRKSLEEESK